MIPATAKPDCTACAKSGGTYDMHCRECVIVLLQETKRMLQVAA